MVARKSHSSELRLRQFRAFPVGFDAGHAAGSVAQALFLLTLAVLVGGALPQAFLALKFSKNL
jgi:hypothetical protein